ncbi:MAG: hypothetical protein FIA92_05110 [Chloroflexi bacterium]|nr:hypothetical protein [Chloroflexota bacterium]
MRFRLQDEELRSLYATGTSSRVTDDVAMTIFGVLEAIEAAASLDDLRSLVSLRFSNHPSDQFEFALPSGWRLIGRRVAEAGSPVMIIDEIRGNGEGRAG